MTRHPSQAALERSIRDDLLHHYDGQEDADLIAIVAEIHMPREATDEARENMRGLVGRLLNEQKIAGPC